METKRIDWRNSQKRFTAAYRKPALCHRQHHGRAVLRGDPNRSRTGPVAISLKTNSTGHRLSTACG